MSWLIFGMGKLGTVELVDSGNHGLSIGKLANFERVSWLVLERHR